MAVFTAIGVGLGFAGTAATVAGVAVVGAVAYGAATMADSSRKAGHAKQQQAFYQMEAQKENQKIAENQNRQQRISMIKRARQASANTRQMAVNVGAETSTSAAAAATNPFVNAGANMGFQNQQVGFMRTRNGFLSQATDAGNAAVGHEMRAATGSAIMQVGMMGFSASGGFAGNIGRIMD